MNNQKLLFLAKKNFCPLSSLLLHCNLNKSQDQNKLDALTVGQSVYELAFLIMK